MAPVPAATGKHGLFCRGKTDEDLFAGGIALTNDMRPDGLPVGGGKSKDCALVAAGEMLDHGRRVLGRGEAPNLVAAAKESLVARVRRLLLHARGRDVASRR